MTVPASGLAGMSIYKTSLGSGSKSIFIFAQDYAENFGGALGVYTVP